MHESILEKKATHVVREILDILPELKNKAHQFEIASQLIRSSTSILMNIEESIGAQSRRDFISKLCISRKELRETQKWIELIEYIRCINNEKLACIKGELIEIYKMLNRSIATARKNGSII